MTKAIDSLELSSQSPIDFFSDIEFEEWVEITGIDNRFKACNVPKNVLDSKTTEALAKSLLHYPMNYLVLMYNNPYDAIRLIIRNSSLHQAFLKRDNAAQVITNLFSTTSLDVSIEKSLFDDDYENVAYVNELFLEYFIGSGVIPEIFTGDYSAFLEQSARAKLSERESDTETFSIISKYPLIEIVNSISNQRIKQKNSSDSTILRSSTVTISTFFKHSLTGIKYDEMNNTDIVNYTNTALTLHPNAIMRGSATLKYNCHSFAWHNSSLTNDVWLNESHNGSPQLYKYWTDDLYVGCDQSSAEKVYYSSGDHSAIVLPNGKYLSKWGPGPLMEHDYYDCPYNYSSLQYYAERITPLTQFTTINGNSSVYVNQNNIYSFNSNYNMSFSVHMQYMESDYPLPCTLNQIGSGVYSLTCDDPGYYTITVEGYRNGYCIARAVKGIVAWPNE